MALYQAYLQQLGMLVQQEMQMQQMMMAAQQFSQSQSQGGGGEQGGSSVGPQMGQAMMQPGELSDETMPSAGGGASGAGASV